MRLAACLIRPCTVQTPQMLEEEQVSIAAETRPDRARTEELLAKLLVYPDSLTEGELRELAKGILDPMLARRRH